MRKEVEHIETPHKPTGGAKVMVAKLPKVTSPRGGKWGGLPTHSAPHVPSMCPDTARRSRAGRHGSKRAQAGLVRAITVKWDFL